MTSGKVDVVVAGHACVDIFPSVPAFTGSFAELFRPGKLINVEAATISTGGVVPNTGLPLRRLGKTVRLMGKCGNDLFGSALVDKLTSQATGDEISMRVVDGETTSYTIVISPPGIDRIFLHCPGANDTFDAADIDQTVVAAADLFHFGYPPLMARTYGNGGQELAQIMANAKSAGATTSLDLALPDPAGPSRQVDWPAIFRRTLPHVDLFVPSIEELAFTLQRSAFDTLLARAADGDLLAGIDGKLLGELGQACIDAGVAVVVIKCGRLGLYVRTAGKQRLEKTGRARPGSLDDWADRELFEPSYHVEKVVSAAGSGDNAVAGFLAAYLNGCGVEDALRYACAVGAQNVQVLDTTSGVKSWDETTRQVRANRPKNEVTIPLRDWRFDSQAAHWISPRDRQR